MYKLVFDKKVIKDLKQIDSVWQKKILDKINEVLVTVPYDGKHLVGNMSNFYRIRVGDYRIIYEIIDNIVTVEIIKIAHRREVY
ncbi:MAG: type II toxin-antitoxin system RelE/ParE family toxin [Sulfuricurvum sp.]|nr:type II toxin-antitoxin system RelE/ParE family toxin [Sulfuricurvum sp.]MDP3022963.1 type II toxin-antitoxin system RelE/ParE family toxin [Sulfuricurvum sp.]MDP3119772.1 type II toxin-antitoxin system RelE/ParE family toxin [Sulfuricurvum sp.]